MIRAFDIAKFEWTRASGRISRVPDGTYLRKMSNYNITLDSREQSPYFVISWFIYFPNPSLRNSSGTPPFLRIRLCFATGTYFILIPIRWWCKFLLFHNETFIRAPGITLRRYISRKVTSHGKHEGCIIWLLVPLRIWTRFLFWRANSVHKPDMFAGLAWKSRPEDPICVFSLCAKRKWWSRLHKMPIKPQGWSGAGGGRIWDRKSGPRPNRQLTIWPS